MSNFKTGLLFNFILISFLIYVINSYCYEREIVSKGACIKYVFLEKYCHNSSRIRSQLKILYNNKKYYVEVNSKICKNFNKNTNGEEIKLFYNIKNDSVFIEDNIYKLERGIKVLVGLIFIFTIYLIYEYPSWRKCSK
jgi:hypothetical protein